MSDTGEKGKFDTNISDQVIEEALRSVQKHTGSEEVPVEVEEPSTSTGTESSSALQKEVEELRAQLDLSLAKGREMMEKVKDSHEKMLRAAADLDNYRKRAQKEKDELSKYGAERLLKQFLPVLDNLDRAIEHAKGSADFQSLVQGVAMTRKLFDDTLVKNGVKGFSAVGQPFDPRFHEAMQQVETAEAPPNQVVGEMMRGYMLNDRLLRPALVMVAKAAAPPAPAAEPAPAEAAPSGPGSESAESEVRGEASEGVTDAAPAEGPKES